MKKFLLRLPRKGLSSVVPAAAVAAGAIGAAHAAPRAFSGQEEVGFALTDNVPALDIDKAMSTSSVVRVYSVDDSEWQSHDESKFISLAKKEALGDIAASDLEVLEALSEKRNRLKHRRSIDDLIFYAKQEQARVELIEAMSRFLKAFNQPRWQGSKRNK